MRLGVRVEQVHDDVRAGPAQPAVHVITALASADVHTVSTTPAPRRHISPAPPAPRQRRVSAASALRKRRVGMSAPPRQATLPGHVAGPHAASPVRRQLVRRQLVRRMLCRKAHACSPAAPLAPRRHVWVLWQRVRSFAAAPRVVMLLHGAACTRWARAGTNHGAASRRRPRACTTTLSRPRSRPAAASCRPLPSGAGPRTGDTRF